jgi:RNase P subunit RPR2
LKIKVSFSKRLKQFLCKHKRPVNISCCSEGINSKKGYWYVDYHCMDCGFSYGEWIKADRNEMEKLFAKEIHNIK